jgi:hypothetical protein
MVENDTYSEVTIPSPVKGFNTDVKCIKFNFPETLNDMDIGDPVYSIFAYEEDTLRSRLNIDFNIPHKNTLNIIIYNKNIINKDFIELFAPHIKYKYVYCSLNGTPLNIFTSKLYMKYFTKKIIIDNKKLAIYRELDSYIREIYDIDNKKLAIYRELDSYIREIYEYESKVKQGKAFCKIIKEELVSVAFHPRRICPMIMKYGPEILDDL